VSKFMPVLQIVNSLRDSASSVDSHFVLNIPTGNVFKSVNVNLKCIFINHDLNYLSRKLKYKQTFAIVCSFTVRAGSHFDISISISISRHMQKQ